MVLRRGRRGRAGGRRDMRRTEKGWLYLENRILTKKRTIRWGGGPTGIEKRRKKCRREAGPSDARGCGGARPVSGEAGRERPGRPRKRHARRGRGEARGVPRLSEEGHRADALAPGADERRDKLRKAAGRSKCPAIRRCLNGETRRGKTPPPRAEHIGTEEGTRRTETSK